MVSLAIYTGLALCGFFCIAAYIQWMFDSGRGAIRRCLLDYAARAAEEEERSRREREKLRLEEEERQKQRIFRLDCMITHGEAFGGYAATDRDGTFRRDSVRLDRITMHGRRPSGQTYTYYIEDEDIRICASDHDDELVLLSDGMPFVLRESGMGRGEGQTLHRAVIKKDILYYVILESRHELSVRATKPS